MIYEAPSEAPPPPPAVAEAASANRANGVWSHISQRWIAWAAAPPAPKPQEIRDAAKGGGE